MLCQILLFCLDRCYYQGICGHNPDPLFWLVGEANESTVLVEGQETRALLDWFSVVSYFIRLGKEIEIKTTTATINFTN